MFELWSAGHSVLREKVLEHVFLAELSKSLLLRMKMPFEVLRAEFDAHGYDLVLEANGILRHVQLKATRLGGKRADVDVSLELARKPGGCVLWFMVNESTLELGPFYWFGGAPGVPLPPLGDRVSRHTRPNASGNKTERSGLRNIRIGQFTKLDSIDEVATALFGPAAADHDRLLAQHLAERGIDLRSLQLPRVLCWADSAEFAHLVEGYALAEAAGLGDPIEYQERARAEAERVGHWRGTALELWVALFLEHRRARMSGPVGIDLPLEEPPILDALCEALTRSLARVQHRS
jgi:hypothetical protein